MNTAEYLVKKLEELGVNDFFGVPGDYNFELLYAIENNTNTNWYGCSNELNAGYSADGYARLRGYGALVTTYGVGELSAINAVAGSMAENVPVINIVGIPATKNINNKTRLHHNLDDVNYFAFMDAYKNVTNSTSLLTRDNAKNEIDRTLKLFVKEKKPVYIAIPQDIAIMEISEKDVSYDWYSDEEKLNLVASKIIDKIKNSQKPVILGDILIKRFDAVLEYREFVEKSKIPVTNFQMGVNLVDMDYELYLGGYFAGLANPIAEKYVNETDCMIAVGTIYSELNAYGFHIPYNMHDHIAIYGTHTYVDGVKYDDVKMSDLLERIAELVEPKDLKIDKPKIGYEKKEASSKNLTSNYIYPRIQEYINANDIVFVDTGVLSQGIAMLKLPPNAEINSQVLWGSIGWATPATFGACIAKPKSRVILLTGEGAHQISAIEIGNMMRYGLKPSVIVLNNKGYSIERVLSKSPEDKFNDIIQMNYSKFARSFEGDVWSAKVTTEDDLDKALRVSHIMNKMCYIEVCTEAMDVPKFTKDMINSFKKTQTQDKAEILHQFDKVKKFEKFSAPEKTEVVEDKISNIEKNTEVSNVSEPKEQRFTFETVVHKGLTED